MYQGKKLTAAQRIAKAQGKLPPAEDHQGELLEHAGTGTGTGMEAIEVELGHTGTLDETDWSPERKIVGAAIATILCFTIQIITSIDFPVGVEGAVAVIAGYLIPNKR